LPNSSFDSSKNLVALAAESVVIALAVYYALAVPIIPFKIVYAAVASFAEFENDINAVPTFFKAGKAVIAVVPIVINI